MDCLKTGKLLLKLRKEKHMTQREVADRLRVSAQAVSKWERGLGCPDVALLNELAEILEVSTSVILAGDLASNEADGGNMKRIKFYVCPDCGNVVTSTGTAAVSCCGKILKEQKAEKEDAKHVLTVETIDDEYNIKLEGHPMEKGHYLSFIAYVTCDKLNINKLYPEMSNEVRFRKSGRGLLYAFCSEHGLFVQKI